MSSFRRPQFSFRPLPVEKGPFSLPFEKVGAFDRGSSFTHQLHNGAAERTAQRPFQAGFVDMGAVIQGSTEAESPAEVTELGTEPPYGSATSPLWCPHRSP